MATTFEKRNFCAITLALVIFALTIAAVVVNWYHQSDVYHRATTAGTVTTTSEPTALTNTVELNYTKVYYDFEGFTVETKVSAGTIDSTFNTYSARSGASIKSVVQTSQAFTLIALVTSFVVSVLLSLFLFDRIRNKFIFSLGMTFTRVFVSILALLIAASLIIAFLGFLGVTSAFQAELGTCTEGPCRSFSDSLKTEGLIDVSSSQNYKLIRTQEWGPDAGWYIDLAAIPISIVLLAVVVINKFPLPIDSEASSGEAL